MDAATLEAGRWWANSRGEKAAQWVETYQRSLHSRQRTAIADIVRELGAETVVEIGCHCGPNLVRLAQQHPTLRAIGVDINAEAIDAGRSWVQTLGLESRVQLNVGRVPGVTDQLPSQSVDVVLSCYALAYVAPADLDGVLYEMGRLATKAVILAEPQGAALNARSLSGYSEWVHPYADAVRWLGTWQGMTLRTVPIDPPLDRLNAILVASRMPSEGATPSWRG